VGSLGGILAIKNGVCHLAGLHLLDPETGEYNFPSIRQYLNGIDVKAIHLVYREQGLIVQKGKSEGNQRPGGPYPTGGLLHQPPEGLGDEDPA
jgi:putative molybdopterin biosynthesis protein